MAECSTSWNGVLRIGFTSCNPASFSGVLPKYACPGTSSNRFKFFFFVSFLSPTTFFFSFPEKKTDLTSRPGFWGKALPERYVDVGVLFAFHFTASGDVMLNVNGQDKGVFLTGVDARTPLWIMVDIYGNTTAVQFVGKNLTPPPPILALCPSCRRIHDILLSPLFQIPEAV